MNKKLSIFSIMTILGIGTAVAAPEYSSPAISRKGFEYESGDFKFKASGYGTFGALHQYEKDALLLGDWRIRVGGDYSINNNYTFGIVYALDQIALDQGKYSRDAFMFFDNKNLGRIEIGLTDSVVTKMGLGLPDVGGLRLNEDTLLLAKIPPTGTVISNTTIFTGRYFPRINLTTLPTRPVQYGASFTALSDQYKYAADIGLKYRKSDGKTKTAFTMGASFVDSPENFWAEIYSPRINADWRAQVSSGVNIQYNSWIFGMSARAIYDQNPIGAVGDGFSAGTGISYDLLKYTLSGSYIISNTGIWDSEIPNHINNIGVLSFRYKYSEDVDVWISGGASSDTPFISAGLRMKI